MGKTGRVSKRQRMREGESGRERQEGQRDRRTEGQREREKERGEGIVRNIKRKAAGRP